MTVRTRGRKIMAKPPRSSVKDSGVVSLDTFEVPKTARISIKQTARVSKMLTTTWMKGMNNLYLAFQLKTKTSQTLEI